MGKVLIIDDDVMLAKALAGMIKSVGHHAMHAPTLEKGIEVAGAQEFDVVFLDVGMPDGSGLSAITEIKQTPSNPEVIIFTASGEPDGAELAIRSGVWDYVEKSPSIKELLPLLSRAFEYRKEKQSKKPPIVLKRDKIIGRSPRVQQCIQLLAQASACDANVLITGETGTGKELFAQAIHENSSRAGADFVIVDCTALPENLVESVLFGHKKGAFTGADRDKEGLIQLADGGTLFLDEVGELPLELQKKFLRVLQERTFRPVGGKEERPSNFRLVAATNKDLDQVVESGEFRQDLLFRLRALHIELPPLRERGEDIRDLTLAHVARLCDLYGMENKGLSSEFLQALSNYEWPGNIRELVNTLDAAVALAGNAPKLYCNHLPMHLRARIARSAFTRNNEENKFLEVSLSNGDLPKYKEFRDFNEKHYLSQLLLMTHSDVEQACRLSGISRTRLYELCSKHDISFSKSSRQASVAE